jgi:hypothetical protein
MIEHLMKIGVSSPTLSITIESSSSCLARAGGENPNTLGICIYIETIEFSV